MDHQPSNFAEFWPHYLHAHQDWRNRTLHFVGTAGGLILFAAAVVAGQPLLALLAPVWGYGLAWIGHFVFENNRPLALRHFLWSFRGDMRMFGLTITGRIAEERRRVAAEAVGDA